MDYDGTIVKSNDIKDEAFESILNDWPLYKDKMISWHKTKDNIDRKEKFTYFVEKILKRGADRTLINQLVKRFSLLTKKKIIECPQVEGVIYFLNYFKNKVPLYLLSATPQAELNEIVIKTNLDKYFNGIYGAPIDKSNVLNKIIFNEKINSNETVFFGDSISDQISAEKANVKFIGIKTNKNNPVSSKIVLKNYFEFFDKIYND